VELHRLRRLPTWLLERRTIARRRIGVAARAAFGHRLAEHRSPLLREPSLAGTPLQRGKEHNVGLAAAHLDGLCVEPHQWLSYHHAVGRPSRLRGFRPGLELRRGRLSQGIGGGGCQVSNLLFLLGLEAGLRLVERHRHSLDLFPDHQRTVPFGCGATVFYNAADLRFENPLDQPVLLRMRVIGGELLGQLCTRRDPGWRVTVYEVGHRFYQQAGQWMRENRIRRRIVTRAGVVLADHEVVENRARVLYEPDLRQPRSDGVEQWRPKRPQQRRA
jgi:vancomycin resistance protein VanW